MRKKLLVSFFLSFVFLILLAITSKADAASLEKTEINLYAVDDELLEEFPELKIPSNYPQEDKIVINGTDEKLSSMYIYEISSDGEKLQISKSVQIDKETGIIKPQKVKIGSSGNYEERYAFETLNLCINTGDEELQFTVNIIDYADIYVENKLKEYVNQNLENLSDYDKSLNITKYVARNFDYISSYQSVTDMYLYKGGDCWASANMINKLCELAGLTSHTRNGNQDVGAGSGHENNAILIDGKVYVADAGYSGKGESRPYDFYLEDPAFTSRQNSDGTLTILQYDGFEEDTLTIPSTINGKKVTAIASDFSSNSVAEPKKIVLPNTITTIEEMAFYKKGNSNLQSTNIPKGVTEIGYAAFSGCKNLKIELESGGNFILENNVIFNKDKTILIEVLNSYNGSETYTIPDTVTQITKSSFFDVEKIKYVNIPSSIEEIGKEAFFGSCLEGVVIPKTVKKIDYAAFAGTSLVSIEFEDGCTAEIGEYAFAQNYYLLTAKIPSSITNIEKNAFNSDGNLTIYGNKGSKIEEYANANDIAFSTEKIELQDKFLTVGQTEITYDPNKALDLQIEVKYMGKTLKSGTDYSITYDDEPYKPGDHTVTIVGTGNFAGEISKEYTINKAESPFTYECENITVGDTLKPKIYNPGNQSYSIMVYYTDGKYYGTSLPASVGDYIIQVRVMSSDYYKFKNLTAKVKINEASIPLEDIKIVDRTLTDKAYVGDIFQLEVEYVPSNATFVRGNHWTTSNSEIATVDENGLVKVVGTGTCFIYHKIGDEMAFWRVQSQENTNPLSSINISTIESNTMTVGDKVKLNITMNPTNATCNSSVQWSSSDSKVISIDKNGYITANKSGTAIITAEKGGKQATYKITVKDKQTEEKPDDETNKLPYTDVKQTDWYYSAVDYVYKNKIMSGYNDTTFAPNATLTRAMLVTILHNMEGQPYQAGTSKFPDVQDTTSYYYVAVKWATANKIVSGYDNGNFGPNDPITREQLAVMLNQYCKYKSKYKSVIADYSKFKDSNKISSFATWGMNWAVGTGVIGGSNGYLNPQGTATRAEVASMIYKYNLYIK